LSRPTPQQLVDSAPQAVVVDRELSIRAVGAHALALLGHELEDLVGMPFEAILSERVRAHHVDALRAAFNRPDAKAALGPLCVVGVRKGGEECELNVELEQVATRRGVMMVASIREALREAPTVRPPRATRQVDSTYRVVFESLPDTVLVVDADGAFQLANRALPAPFGDGGNGGSAFAGLDPEARRTLEAAIARVAREGRTVELELSCPGRGAAPASYFCRVSRLEERSAAPRFAVVITDVTHRLDLAAERATADRMESVGALAAGLAHEINQPLTTVIANLDYVVEELEELETVDEKLATVGAALRDARLGANRVRDLVRDVKMLSRGDDAQREVVDARWIVEASLALAKDEILRRARLVRAFAKTPQIECNSGRLGHAILHLLMNAVEAIPEGSAASNEIRVATHVDAAGRVVIEIHDTGMGIAEADLPRLFTPFFTRKPAGEGEGLGLAICRRIVTAAGGEVEVESKLGVGTTVRVLLPAADERAGGGRRDAQPQEARERHAHEAAAQREGARPRRRRRGGRSAARRARGSHPDDRAGGGGGAGCDSRGGTPRRDLLRGVGRGHGAPRCAPLRRARGAPRRRARGAARGRGSRLGYPGLLHAPRRSRAGVSARRRGAARARPRARRGRDRRGCAPEERLIVRSRSAPSAQSGSSLCANARPSSKCRVRVRQQA
jgi:signal transduction histidine kinase